jgi:bla regulator protein blaR1
MSSQYFSTIWTALAPALGNHLWQSTLFATAAGLLTLVLRQNHARTRYWLWLAASAKFLIPYSLLVWVGSHVAWSHSSSGSNAGLYVAMEEVSQPFTLPSAPMVTPSNSTAAFSNLLHALPILLASVWLCGFIIVLCIWYVRWRRISVVVRQAVPLSEGRELNALRRQECIAGMSRRTQILSSHTTLEPGIFGISRPVLVWPHEISEHLEDAHLDSILAHELCHVRRRDNLAAAAHMLVEAIFWFHPLVWWLGTRLMEERERACDEQVLESGSDRKAYAEGILKICEFCVGYPVDYVSGVTGADLKKRIVRIMTGQVVRKLDFRRKILLGAAATLAFMMPISLGLLNAKQTPATIAQNTSNISPQFETASIKPNKTGEPMEGFSIVGRPAVAIAWRTEEFMATNFTLPMLLQRAYGLQGDQISGGPEWVSSEKYDVKARIDESVLDELRKLSPDQAQEERQRMLQKLLTEQFELALHRETKDIPVYALFRIKDGAGLKAAKPGDTYADGTKCRGGRPCGPGGLHLQTDTEIVGQAVPIEALVDFLSEKLGGHVILDKTGLTGKYDFKLQWSPNGNQDSMVKSILEQLGLRLESQTSPTEVLIIDHTEKPSGS